MSKNSDGDISDSESGSTSSAEGPPIFTGQRVSKGKRRKRNSASTDGDEDG